MPENEVIIAVITQVPKKGKGRNLCDHVFTRDDLSKGTKHLLPKDRSGFIKLPVFRLGEILLLDERGRDIFGLESVGRKPSNWFVEYETFALDEAGKAMRRALEVRRSANPDDYPGL